MVLENMMTTSSPIVGVMEEVFIVSGLVGVQIVYAIYMLFLKRVLALGVNSLSFVNFGGLVSVLFLLPFAVVLEKKKWPIRFSPVLMAQILLLAVTGVAFQVLMLLGIKQTSPAVASAMPNLAPGIIFMIAACARFEKFSIYSKYSRAKVLGTVLCLGGAIAMSFLMSPPSEPNSMTIQSSFTLNKLTTESMSKEWILGCLYLLFAIIILSCNAVLQAATLVHFPAPLTLCAATSLTGSIFTAMIQFVLEGNLNFGSSSLSFKALAAIVTVGAVVTSSCVGFQTWCVTKKGPVIVSIFSPIQTVFSALLSAVILRQVIGMGSLAGMLLMFVGLYIVLWAKKKEDCDHSKIAGDNVRDDDIEKPLLS